MEKPVLWYKLAQICSRQLDYLHFQFDWERQFREKEYVSLQPIGYSESHMVLQILLATSKCIVHFCRADIFSVKKPSNPLMQIRFFHLSRSLHLNF